MNKELGPSNTGPGAGEVVPQPIEILKNSSKNYLRGFAALALGGIGLEAVSAILMLLEIVDETNEEDEACGHRELRYKAECACHPIFAFAILSK